MHHSISQMKHQLDATLCRFYSCRVTLHVSGANARHQEYLKLVIKFLYAKKSKLDEKLLQLQLECADDRNNVRPIIIKSIEDKLTNEMESHYNNLNKKTGQTTERKTKQEKHVNVNMLYILQNTCTSGRRTSFKYSWWWALAPETCRVTMQK